MPAEKFDFRNAQGQTLAALLDRPDGPARAVALFAHCFTCGKSNRAARHIAEGLKLHGIAVLRFDFTGLGASEGEFANTTFSSNVDDLVAAADHLRRTLAAPALLIGHSLGGAAVLAAAHRIPEARPSRRSPRRSIRRTSSACSARCAEIGDKDEVEVTLAGRPFKVRRSFLEDIKQQNLASISAGLHKALLMFPFADRRHRRHRQCQPHFHRGEASQELHLARRRRSSPQPRRRRRLCGARHFGVGRPLSRHGGRCAN